jgi:hypothetical protein
VASRFSSAASAGGAPSRARASKVSTVILGIGHNLVRLGAAGPLGGPLQGHSQRRAGSREQALAIRPCQSGSLRSHRTAVSEICLLRFARVIGNISAIAPPLRPQDARSEVLGSNSLLSTLILKQGTIPILKLRAL